ncbi:MAG: response regulator [Deltaproteobacteria bacterium]|nr:response regulator [Deltaproteobacteria bacterium]MBN2673058.1 response regulator [Deltaproteobacteria bacterium]
MTPQRESVLVVDDDSEVLTALDAELSEYFEVTALMSAEQALATLQGQAFSAIISDVRMPGIDGLTLIKECAVRYPDMVRLLLTAFDDEEVQETALGEFGAYKLIKPWGDDLIVTLQNALKQRKNSIELQKTIDLGSAAVEVDLRLHLNLSPPQILETLVTEIMRVPEVLCVSMIQFDENGRAMEPVVAGTTIDNPPTLTRKRISAPESDGDYYKYTIPVGMWPSPVAACVCRLSKINDDSLRYIDFIGRQAYRSWLITSGQSRMVIESGRLPKGESTGRISIAPKDANWLSKELTTATTVMIGATESLRDEAERLRAQNENAAELEEIASDLDAAYASLTMLLQKLEQ